MWHVLVIFIVPNRQIFPNTFQWRKGYSEWENVHNTIIADPIRGKYLKNVRGRNSFLPGNIYFISLNHSWIHWPMKRHYKILLLIFFFCGTVTVDTMKYTPKYKLVTYQHRANPEISPISMKICFLNEAPEWSIGTQTLPDIKWNAYIQSITKDHGKMVSFFLFVFFDRSRKYQLPFDILYLYKNQIKRKMEYCCQF